MSTISRPPPGVPASIEVAEVWARAYTLYFRFWLNLARTVHPSEEEARDTVHTVLAAIINSDTSRFTSIEHLRNYVARAVLNRAIQTKQRIDREQGWSDSLEAHFAVAPDDTEIDEDRRKEAFRAALRRLSRRDFEIVKLRFYCGYTFQEISQLLTLPISTLKSREGGALKKIRAWMQREGF